MIKIGVTGTKGKTTTVQILESVFLDLKINTYSLYGIAGIYFTSFYNGKPILKHNGRQIGIHEWNYITKPVDVQITEATSHRLDVGSYKNYNFNIAIFTSYENDEHGRLHGGDLSYLAIKKSIFSKLSKTCDPYFKGKGKAIVCRDIERYEEVVSGIEESVITYGEHKDSDYKIDILNINRETMTFSIAHQGKALSFTTKLKGAMNAKNFTAAYIACNILNISDNNIQASFQSFDSPAGRMNHYTIVEKDLEVIIDYAHTKESLENLLLTVKEMFPKKSLHTLFGCGGQRSKTKRKLMGMVADKYSDLIYLTNDNPRKEKPIKIINDIEKGIKNTEKVLIIPDRTQAIKTIISNSYNSVIVLAGKGAEDSIEYNGIKFSHSDKKDVTVWCLANQKTLIEANPS